MKGQGELTYRINAQDVIVFVNDEWDRFAAANAGNSASSQLVLNRSLWDFISDHTTRELYRQILKRSRQGTPIGFNFRCDSPECRRMLSMKITAGDGGEVEFRTQTLSQEHRAAQALLDQNASRSEAFLLTCSWCSKVLIGSHWVEVEELVNKWPIFRTGNPPAITHGICEPCFEMVIGTLEAP